MLCRSLLRSPARRGAAVPALRLRRAFSTQYEMLTTEEVGAVGIVRLNRPKKLNALCSPLVRELADALKTYDASPATRAIILTGNERAFAAGADISEMEQMTYLEAGTLFNELMSIRQLKTPLIAAVAGFALGGGCELAMMTDIIIAARSARFGQPEIKIGTIPGIGGTQRLTRAVGKSKAMEMALTGDMVDAEWAERAGLVSKVVEDDKLMEEALALANKIAAHSGPILALAKMAVNEAYESNLTSGLLFEKKLFESTFATEDQKIGMGAFVKKEKPDWKHK